MLLQSHPCRSQHLWIFRDSSPLQNSDELSWGGSSRGFPAEVPGARAAALPFRTSNCKRCTGESNISNLNVKIREDLKIFQIQLWWGQPQFSRATQSSVGEFEPVRVAMSPFSRTSAGLGIPKKSNPPAYAGVFPVMCCDDGYVNECTWHSILLWMYLALNSPLRGFLLRLIVIVTDLPPSPPPAAWCAAMNTCLRCLLRNALEPLATPCLRDVLLCEQGKNFDICFFCICASWLLITCCVASHHCCILFPAPRSCLEVAARSRNPGCASIVTAAGRSLP